MNLTAVALVGYVLLQLALGLFLSRRIRTESDYLLAGRRLGYGLTTFTLFATWFGAETCIGAAGAIYSGGLAASSADPFGYGLCLLLLGLVFAAPLHRRGLTTLADLFRDRYSKGIERIAVLLLVPSTVLWAAGQVRAFGQVVSAAAGIDLTVGITLAAGVVIIYTTGGGLLADAWTDLIQGVVLIAGFFVLLATILWDVGTAPLASIGPERLSLTRTDVPFFAAVEEWAIPILGSVVSAEMTARIIAAKSPQVARRSAILSSGVYLTVASIPALIGLLGAVLMPNLADAERVLPLMAGRYLHPVLYVVFSGALVSAILSTVDSTLLVASSLVSHNVILSLRPNMTERTKVLIARTFVVTFGFIAYVLALQSESVYALTQEAAAFGSAGFITVVTFGLFTRFGGWRSALAALVIGEATWILGAYVGLLPYPFITSLVAAVAVYVSTAAYERATQGRRLTAGPTA